MRLRDQYRGSLPVDLPQRLYNGGVKVTAGASLDLGQCVFDLYCSLWDEQNESER